MAFNQQRVKAYSQGAQTAYIAPLAAYKGSQIALSGVTGATIVSTAGLVIPLAGSQFNIEWDSLSALVETDITTSTLVVQTKWQGSLDGTNWLDLWQNKYQDAVGTTRLLVAAAGTGSLVTTQFIHTFAGINPGVDYIRYAAMVTTGTGAAGDNLTVSYNFRKRSFLS